MVKIVQSGVLAALKQLTRPYRSGPLPEWDTFAATTRMVTLNPREELPATSSDVFVIVRGLVKVVNPEDGGRVEEFFEGVSIIAPQLRPSWADSARAPLTHAGWRGRRWALTSFDTHAIERTHLLRMDYRVIEQLAAKHPTWGEVHSAFLWTHVEGVFATTTEHRHGTVESRYRTMIGARAGLVGRVSQRDLASYLSITESALSRIAKRVREAPDGALDDDRDAVDSPGLDLAPLPR